MESCYIFDRNKTKYEYNRLHYTEVTETWLFEQCKAEKRRHKKNGRIAHTFFKKGKYSKAFINLYCGFDIETTKCKDSEASFCYTWQFSINKNVIIGNTLDEFVLFLNKLKCLKVEESFNICVFVANLGFEYQYIHKYLNITDCFFKELREPVYIVHDDFIMFRECLSFGGSLKKLAQDYTCLYKMVGDLDYSVYRTPENCILSEKEQKYCDLDVLILSEFSKYFFENFFAKCKNPLTIQSVLRGKIKDNIENMDAWIAKIKRCYPTKKQYNIVMNWLYRGGYTHGKMEYIGHLFRIWNDECIYSFDITSSYPASMTQCYFPYKFHKLKMKVSEQLLLNLMDKKCVYATFEFLNIRAVLGHSIESKSKIVEYDNPIWDNGRLLKADRIVVLLTELDFKTYQKFYEWDSLNFWDVYISERQQLPIELLKPLWHDYTLKAVKKANGENYAIEKSYVNSYYGMTVTRLVEKQIEYNSESMRSEIASCRSWEDMTRKEILNPFHGLYITAHSRYKLLSMCAKLEKNGCPVLYMDTDSIKYIETKDKTGQKLFNMENDIIFKVNKDICKKYELDYNIFSDLGAWDMEHKEPFETFKYLGAKRYLYTIKKKHGREYNCTIAGLPKTWYYKNNATSLVNFYKPFKNNMIAKNCKLASKYFDDELESDGRIIKSCLSLIDTDFSMSLANDWLNVINAMYSDTKMYRRL